MRLRPTRHVRLALAIFLGFLTVRAVTASASAQFPRRPNIVVLLSDDQRADTLHALGNRRIHTPHLDRLAREGTAFTQAHILGALQGAVCVPSRAMMLSGRSLFRVREDLRDTPTWPAQFGSAGWKTFITGKWHNGAASLPGSFSQGQNVFLGGMTDQNQVSVRDLDATGTLSSERTASGPSSETFADTAVRFLNESPHDRPFCLYVAFTSPHDPRTAPQSFRKRYARNPPPLPPNFLPQHPFDNGELTVRDEKLLPWPRTESDIRKELGDYYAMITHLDAQVGRILDALRRSGRHTNTLIVFASDNGLALGSHGLLGKQNLYEHSTRVPLLLSGPGIPRNHRVNQLVTLHQLAATLCDYAGLPSPTGSEGSSLLPLLRDTQSPGSNPRVIFTAYRDIQRAVTDGRWKLIEYPGISRFQLFDLLNDPAETRDLATEPAYADRREQMVALLRQQQRQYSDPLAR